MTNQIVTSKDGQITITVRPGLVEDQIAAANISRSIGGTFPDGTEGLFNMFGYMCSQSIASEGLPFQAELVRSMPLADKRAAYDAFMKLPKALYTTWNKACEAADLVADYALGPEPLTKDAPKNL